MCGNIHTKKDVVFIDDQSLNPVYKPIQCPICLESIWSNAHWCSQCKNPFHTECLKKWKRNCPLCRAKISIR